MSATTNDQTPVGGTVTPVPINRPMVRDFLPNRNLIEDLQTIRPSRRVWLGAWVLSLLNWTLDVACLAASCAALGVHVSVPALLLTYTAGMAASSLTALPGGVGVVEAALILGVDHRRRPVGRRAGRGPGVPGVVPGRRRGHRLGCAGGPPTAALGPPSRRGRGRSVSAGRGPEWNADPPSCTRFRTRDVDADLGLERWAATLTGARSSAPSHCPRRPVTTTS